MNWSVVDIDVVDVIDGFVVGDDLSRVVFNVYICKVFFWFWFGVIGDFNVGFYG